MISRPIGLLIPSSNTMIEREYNRVLPPPFQLHVGRLLMESIDEAGWRSQDADLDHQARLLGTARVEIIILAQTAASFFDDNYDRSAIGRMSSAADAPADTGGRIVGRAARALGARRIGLVGPWAVNVMALAQRYFETAHGLEVVALESIGSVPNRAISDLPADTATAALGRANHRDAEALVLAGGNFGALDAIGHWERQFGTPVVTTNQATLWRIFRALDPTQQLPGFGRLLDTLPAEPS
jgi:maleate cis-trans isomerase